MMIVSTSSRFVDTFSFPLLGGTYLGHHTGCIGSSLGLTSSTYVGESLASVSLSMVIDLLFSSIVNLPKCSCRSDLLTDSRI